MEIIEIVRKGHKSLVRPMRVGDLDKSKCSEKFLSHNFPDDMIVNVRCAPDGTLDLRGKRAEYRIIIPDDMDITAQEQQVLDYLKEVFLQRVESDTREFKAVYWHKWTGTYAIAQHFGVPCKHMRKVMKSLENKKKVHSDKVSGVWLVWALNEIEGFKQHQFKDYFTKAESPVDIMR